MTPPRPPTVTAAAVLLIVVGADVLLVSLAGTAFLLWVAGGFAFIPCVAAAIVVGWVPIYSGGLILSHGVAALRGRLSAPRSIGAASLALGLLGGAAVGLGVLVWLVRVWDGRLSGLTPTAVGVVLFVSLHIAALTVAGLLLARNAARYDAWVRAKAIPPPRDDPDSDGGPLPADSPLP